MTSLFAGKMSDKPCFDFATHLVTLPLGHVPCRDSNATTISKVHWQRNWPSGPIIHLELAGGLRRFASGGLQLTFPLGFGA